MIPTLHDVLTQIFDSEFVVRDEWAAALGVTSAAISQWAKGRTIPDPDHLGAIRLLVHQDDRLPPQVASSLEEVLDRPLEQVVLKPRASMGPTLRHYLVRPRREAAMALLAALPPPEQEEMLIDLGARVRERLAHPRTQSVAAWPAHIRHGNRDEGLERIIEQVRVRKQVLSMVA